MDVCFADPELDRLETDRSFTAGLAPNLVSAFRRRMQMIRGAVDERDFYALKSLHFEKLSGDRQHQRSVRLNEKYRLILEFEGEGRQKIVRVVAIEDYH